MRAERSDRLPVPVSVHLARIWLGAMGLAVVGLIGFVEPDPKLLVAVGAAVALIAHASLAYRRRSADLLVALVVDVLAIGTAATVVGAPPLAMLGPAVYVLLTSTVWVERPQFWLVGGLGTVALLGLPALRQVYGPPQWSVGLEAGIEIIGVLAAVPVLGITAARIHEAVQARTSVEQALVDRSRLNTALVDGSPYGIAVVDSNGIVVSMNRAFSSMFGLDGSPVPFAGLVDEDEVRSIPDGDVGLVSGMRGCEAFPAELASYRVHDDASIRVYFARDVSRREERRRTMVLQSTLLDQTHNSVIATDLAGCVISWNRGAESLFGWSASEVVGKELGDILVFEQDRAQAEAAMAELRETGRWSGEFEVRHRDGSMVPVLVTNSVLTDEDGEMLGFVGVSSDLTERRAIEREVMAAQGLAAKAMDAISAPVVVIDSSGRTVASNRAWRSLAGREDMTVEIVEGMHPVDGRKVALAIAEVASGFSETTHVDSVPIEVDGEQRWYRIEASAVATNVMVTFTDVTRTVLLKRSLEETVASQSQLIAEVSHEVRGPLTNLLGLAETLSSGVHSSHESDVVYGMIAQQANELVHLFDDLLIAARSRGGKLALRSEPVDVAAEVRSVASEIAHERRVDLVIPQSLPILMGDRLRVRQIVRNLISNAVRYGGDRIEASVVASSDAICVAVRDNGSGIGLQDAETMFEPYGRGADGLEHPQSVGLGLHVARELARHMGGDLRYLRQGDWTVFDLTLPIGRTPIEVTRVGADPLDR